MAKQLIFDQEALSKLKKGIDTTAEAVKVTIGPIGHNVLQQKISQPPAVLSDGFTVIKQIVLKDPSQNIGAQLLKEVAQKTKEQTGDGTTTAIILTQVIFNEGIKNIQAGADPRKLKKGIDKAASLAIDILKKNALPVKSKSEICQVAEVSAKDEEIGQMIADTMERVGENGVIKVEEGQGFDTIIRLAKGMHFDRGYISPYMAGENYEVLLENPFILITDKDISLFSDIRKTVEDIAASGRPLFIIANNVEGEALKTLVTNKIQGRFVSVAVKTPDFGEYRKEYLYDIAVLTGGTVISDDSGLKLNNLPMEMLGQAGEVRVSKDETVIVKGKGRNESVMQRVEQIKYQIKNTPSEYKKDKMRERLAKLGGTIAIIQAGGVTEREIKEKRLRIEDALSATRSAIAEGIVAGGGTSLIDVSKEIADDMAIDEDTDVKTGFNIMRKALEAPLREIANNSGYQGVTVVQRVKGMHKGIGFNALTGEYQDMLESGVVDPVKVMRTALQNAACVASLLLLSGGIVQDITGS